jgi:hypothetical protein
MAFPPPAAGPAQPGGNPFGKKAGKPPAGKGGKPGKKAGKNPFAKKVSGKR